VTRPTLRSVPAQGTPQLSLMELLREYSVQVQGIVETPIFERKTATLVENRAALSFNPDGVHSGLTKDRKEAVPAVGTCSLSVYGDPRWEQALKCNFCQMPLQPRCTPRCYLSPILWLNEALPMGEDSESSSTIVCPGNSFL
jgi:hypothetical protein